MKKPPTNPDNEKVQISPPKLKIVELLAEGTAPLVIENFAKKGELMAAMQEGGGAKNKKKRDKREFEKDCEEAKHISTEGWEGFNAAGIRAAMISACRLVGFKMTVGKLAFFVIPDGESADATPLIRIYGPAILHTAHVRNATGVIDVRARPMYKKWAARLRIEFDTDQFSVSDIVNLIARAGRQVGIGAGRPDSKQSAGMGWGTFRIVPDAEWEAVQQKYEMA